MKTRFIMLVLFIVACVPNAFTQGKGDIQVTCEPGIRIYIDNAFSGKTNTDDGGLYLEGVSAGNHQLKAVKRGFSPKILPVVVKPEETIEVRVGTLEPKLQITQEGDDKSLAVTAQTGSVQVRSIPLHCKLAFLGRAIDKTKDRVRIDNIPLGTYKLTATRSAQTLDASVPILQGRVTEVLVRFKDGRIEVEVPETVVRVAGILKGSQAERLGILQDDIVISYGGTSFTTVEELVAEVQRRKDGGLYQIELVVQRGDSRHTFKCVPGTIGINIQTIAKPDSLRGDSHDKAQQ